MEKVFGLDFETVGEAYEEAQVERGGGGGGKKRRVFGEKGRREKKGSEARVGQEENAKDRHPSDEKSPRDEVDSVLAYLARQDEGNVDMPATILYIKWLSEAINRQEIAINESECGNWEQMTASVKAGGGGRQTSRNARARTHLVTGIRATAEKSRQAGPNEKLVMGKLKSRLEKHIANWRTLMACKKGQEVTGEKIEEEVLARLSGMS